MWEDLRATLLLELAGFQLEKNFEDTLNQYFLENPEDELLLELEFISADLNKTLGVLDRSIAYSPKYDRAKCVALICQRLEELYHNTALEEFAPCASKLLPIGPPLSDLGYAGGAFSKKDFARADAIYREMFEYDSNGCDREPRSGIICEADIDIREYASVCPGSVEPDFEKAEMFLGFRLNENVKDFYSRVFTPTVVGTIDIPEAGFTVPIGNKRFDTWFQFQGINGRTEIRLFPCTGPKSSARHIRDHFSTWTGGNDFGQRAYIGELLTNIGSITIVINNRTGAVEWVDCEYGHYKKYEKNPHGILAENMDAFLQKLLSFP